MTTHYHVLAVPREATLEEVHAAWKQAAKAKHPNAGGSPEAWAQVNEAYTVLRDVGRRKLYDQHLDTSLPPCFSCDGSGERWTQNGFRKIRAGYCMRCKGVGVVDDE